MSPARSAVAEHLTRAQRMPHRRTGRAKSALRGIAGCFAAWLATALGTAYPREAAGQGIRGVLRQIERATRPDSATHRPSSAATSAVASGAALQIVDQQLDAGDSLAVRFSSDTGLKRVPSAGACGVARACVPGWDLRAVRVMLPGAVLPAGAPVVVTTEVENRGRQPAPASELRLCFAASRYLGCDRAAAEPVTLPPLEPGEHAVVRRAVEWPSRASETVPLLVIGTVDPDHTLGERDVSNNAAVSPGATASPPALQFVAVDLPADARTGATFPLRIAIRNTSTVTPSPATDLQLSGAMFCVPPGRQTTFGGGPNRLAVPALAPRQTVTYRVIVPDAVVCRSTDASLSLRLDPGDRVRWGMGHERSLTRRYAVR